MIIRFLRKPRIHNTLMIMGLAVGMTGCAGALSMVNVNSIFGLIGLVLFLAGCGGSAGGGAGGGGGNGNDGVTDDILTAAACDESGAVILDSGDNTYTWIYSGSSVPASANDPAILCIGDGSDVITASVNDTYKMDLVAGSGSKDLTLGGLKQSRVLLGDGNSVLTFPKVDKFLSPSTVKVFNFDADKDSITIGTTSTVSGGSGVGFDFDVRAVQRGADIEIKRFTATALAGGNETIAVLRDVTATTIDIDFGDGGLRTLTVQTPEADDTDLEKTAASWDADGDTINLIGSSTSVAGISASGAEGDWLASYSLMSVSSANVKTSLDVSSSYLSFGQGVGISGTSHEDVIVARAAAASNPNIIAKGNGGGDLFKVFARSAATGDNVTPFMQVLDFNPVQDALQVTSATTPATPTAINIADVSAVRDGANVLIVHGSKVLFQVDGYADSVIRITLDRVVFELNVN